MSQPRRSYALGIILLALLSLLLISCTSRTPISNEPDISDDAGSITGEAIASEPTPEQTTVEDELNVNTFFSEGEVEPPTIPN